MYKVSEGYSRTQFAKKIGVSISTVYYWEKQGLIKPLRTFANKPYYTDEHIKQVKKKG